MSTPIPRSTTALRSTPATFSAPRCHMTTPALVCTMSTIGAPLLRRFPPSIHVSGRRRLGTCVHVAFCIATLVSTRFRLGATLLLFSYHIPTCACGFRSLRVVGAHRTRPAEKIIERNADAPRNHMGSCHQKFFGDCVCDCVMHVCVCVCVEKE